MIFSAGLSKETFDKVRAATFAILDKGGHPISCGFFVSACGVALTAAHEADTKWLRKKGKKSMALAATHDDKTFDLEVVERKVGDLGIAVLRLVPSAAAAGAAAQACLPVPETTFTEKDLSGAPVNLVHGSIAWSAGASSSNFAQNCGRIVMSNAETIRYNVGGPGKGHSGAALLLLQSRQVIGLRSEGRNDNLEEYSERSPSNDADAVRLDLPAVREAVGRHLKKKSA